MKKHQPVLFFVILLNNCFFIAGGFPTLFAAWIVHFTGRIGAWISCALCVVYTINPEDVLIPRELLVSSTIICDAS